MAKSGITEEKEIGETALCPSALTLYALLYIFLIPYYWSLFSTL
jgi:hypothetical protein